MVFETLYITYIKFNLERLDLKVFADIMEGDYSNSKVPDITKKKFNEVVVII